MKEITHLEMQNAPHCHSRENGNPDSTTEGMDSRLRGNDKIHGSDEICWNDRVKYFATQSAQKKCRKFIGYILIIGIFLVPHLSLAIGISGQCSSNGYTIATINGIFTNEQGAQENMLALQKVFGFDWHGQGVDFKYLLNPSHLAGVGDLLMSVYQKIFDSETVQDYDLIEMLKSASEKVKTQKLLLVAHSQGNFYANSFYDTVAGKQGGVPSESIGVYSVATPASRVAGGGKWLTSDTDKIIAGVVGRMYFKNIMPPNTHIELQNGDDANGHNFKDVYLKYRSAEIVANIQASLNRLSENTLQSENKSCLSAPELTLAHKLEGAVLAVADPVANTGSDAAAFAGKAGAKATVWTYNAGATAMKAVAQTAIAAASSITAVAKSLTIGTTVNLTESNAAAIVASVGSQSIVVPVSVPAANKQSISALTSSLSPSLAAKQTTALASQAVSSNEKKLFEALLSPNTAVKAMTENGSPPKLVFVGRRMSGIGSSPPLAAAEKIETAKKETETEPAAEAEEKLSAPALSSPQCASSLATDGCLLAETAARFEWAPVAGAFYYGVNKNGVYATTTETALKVTASDFSDYTFGASAVGASGQKSATSTKTISVATIPIAINEIAWMGTLAAANDEWFELKNNTAFTIDLSQWVLASQDGAPYVKLSKTIAPHEYLVFERTSSATVANVAEHSIYTGALNNSGDKLSLSYGSTTMDQTPNGAWTAGDNATKKTMERYNPKTSGDSSENWTTWGTNIDFIKNGKDADGNQILGTPGLCNSARYININGGENITSDLTLAADNCYYISAGVRVAASSTLAIEAGAQVSLNQNNLYIDGVLDARGEEKNPIAFDSFSGSATSNRIIISGNSGTSTINNAIISETGGIKLNNGAAVEITNTNFANNKAGVELNGGSSAIIENANFASTTSEAVAAYGGSIASISSSTITNTIDADAVGVYNSNLSISSTTINVVYDGDGIGAYNSTVSLASSTVSNVLSGDGIGLYNSTVSIASSTISNVLSGDGIGLYNSTSTIANVAVKNVDGDGIAVYGGSISGNATVDGAEVEY